MRYEMDDVIVGIEVMVVDTEKKENGKNGAKINWRQFDLSVVGFPLLKIGFKKMSTVAVVMGHIPMTPTIK